MRKLQTFFASFFCESDKKASKKGDKEITKESDKKASNKKGDKKITKESDKKATTIDGEAYKTFPMLLSVQTDLNKFYKSPLSDQKSSFVTWICCNSCQKSKSTYMQRLYDAKQQKTDSLRVALSSATNVLMKLSGELSPVEYVNTDKKVVIEKENAKINKAKNLEQGAYSTPNRTPIPAQIEQ